MRNTGSRPAGELAAAILGFAVAMFIAARRSPRMLPFALFLALIGLLLLRRKRPSLRVGDIEIVVSPILKGCQLGIRHERQLTVSAEMFRQLRSVPNEAERAQIIQSLKIIDTKPSKS